MTAMQPYTPTDIMLARIQTLVSLGYDREEAARMVAETFSVRPPGA
jgi:Holliday junction resolvasome RuvABC DNA-binding subunit